MAHSAIPGTSAEAPVIALWARSKKWSSRMTSSRPIITPRLRDRALGFLLFHPVQLKVNLDTLAWIHLLSLATMSCRDLIAQSQLTLTRGPARDDTRSREQVSARSTALGFNICSHQCKQTGHQASGARRRQRQRRGIPRERERAPENNPESGPVLTGRSRPQSLAGACTGTARSASTGRAASTSSWQRPAPKPRRRPGCSDASARRPQSRPSW